MGKIAKRKKRGLIFKSVKMKIIVGFVAIVFINAIAFQTLDFFDTYKSLEEQALDRTYAYGEHIEKVISPIGINNNEKIQEKIVDLQNNQYKNIGYIGVLDSNFTYVANTDKSKIGETLKGKETEQVMRNRSFVSFIKGENKDKEYISIVPLYNISTKYNDVLSGASAKVDVPGLVVVSIPHKALIEVLKDKLINIGIIGIIICFISLIIAVIISRTITKPIDIIRGHLKIMGEGRLDKDLKVSTGDELSQLAEDLNRTRVSLKKMIINTKSTSIELDNSSSRLFKDAEELSRVSEEITQSIKEVAEASFMESSNLSQIFNEVEDFSRDLNNINEKLMKVHSGSMEIESLSYEGSNKIKDLTLSINEIIYVFKEVKDNIEMLISSISNINLITKSMKGLARQTGLLSLNASIEASKTGESGGGFIVIASEIKKLSEETLEATGNIESLVGEISKGATKVYDNMYNGEKRVINESDSINNSVEIFKIIVHKIKDIVPEIHEISNTLKKVTDKKDNIFEHVKSISSISEEIACSTEEVSKAIEEQASTVLNVSEVCQGLSNRSIDMVNSVEKFKI